MVERRVTQVLDEWRELERRIAAGAAVTEVDGMTQRIAELRDEYRRLSAAGLEASDDQGAPVEPPERAGDPAVPSSSPRQHARSAPGAG